jgi:hypothetical protein
MSADQKNTNVFANTKSHRFETEVDGHKAFLQYYLSENSIVFTHTEVPKEIEGHGVGASLARAGLDYARHESLAVVPLCPFVEQYIRKHPSELELVEPSYRKKLSPEPPRA